MRWEQDSCFEKMLNKHYYVYFLEDLCAIDVKKILTLIKSSKLWFTYNITYKVSPPPNVFRALSLSLIETTIFFCFEDITKTWENIEVKRITELLKHKETTNKHTHIYYSTNLSRYWWAMGSLGEWCWANEQSKGQ